MIIKDKIIEKGIKQVFIAKELEITDRTLNNWMNLKNIDNFIKFLRLLEMLGISNQDIINEYEIRED